MKKIPAHTISSPPRRALVYQIVFERALVRVFVLMLLCSFSLQTVERSFAFEVDAAPTAEVLSPVTDEAIAVLTNEVEVRTDEVFENSPTEELFTPIVPEPIVTETSTTEIDTEFDAGGGVVAIDESAVVPGTEPDLLLEATTTEVITETASTTASTTLDSVPTLTVESDQMIQFDKTNCLAVEDGSFYCQQSTTTEPTTERGLFALPDVDGDLEIYVKDGDTLTQISFNTVDDASPYYDPASDTMVWHRLIDERYQIVVHDVASGEEFQLTDTSTNNMEPFRADNIIVWQHWASDAWQIMMYDGSSIKQLTETVEHNLAPVVRNNLVVWHRVMYGEKTIEVYDLDTEAYMTIQDEEGGTITNPRMVLVYDATMDNGDVVTRGFDLVTGEITSFAAEPAPLPEDIPEPDATGETRALINSKVSEEDQGESEPETTGTSTLPLSIGDDATTTPVSDLTLDLTADIPLIESPTEVAPPIPDLVIGPFVPPTSPVDIPVVE